MSVLEVAARKRNESMSKASSAKVEGVMDDKNEEEAEEEGGFDCVLGLAVVSDFAAGRGTMGFEITADSGFLRT